MFPLLESLKLKNGMIQNLDYHQARLNRSLDELFNGSEIVDLKREILIPENCRSGIYKVRVLYGPGIGKIEIAPYNFRAVQSLKVVHHESIDYHLKFTDRQILDELFAQRGNCDDIIIVRNGLVTDSFAANLLFLDGDRWLTPTSPLLKGTNRQLLLDRGIISEMEIGENDIRNFQKIGLINAMIDFDKMPVVPVDRVFS
ncbi:MAG: hypothetical protein A2066_10965 [Bacteroidetes bacterium GWB2_41_8]|nr:MAG: hypothetical protein A2066_10965 [Bacteroidetes bacterium GWB2_41_8]